MNNTKSISFLLQFVYKDIKLLERAGENVTCELVSLKKYVFFTDQFKQFAKRFLCIKTGKREKCNFSSTTVVSNGQTVQFCLFDHFWLYCFDPMISPVKSARKLKLVITEKRNSE